MGRFVQSGCVVSGANPTVLLPFLPTVGNTLVAIGSHYNNNPSVANGYTQLTINNGDDDGTMSAYKTVDNSDTINQTPFNTGNSGQSLCVFEIEGSTGVPSVVSYFFDNKTNQLTLGDNGSPDTGCYFGVFCQNSSKSDFAVNSGADTVAETTGNTSSNSPRRIKGFALNATGGEVSVQALLDGDYSSTGQMVYVGGVHYQPIELEPFASQISVVVPSRSLTNAQTAQFALVFPSADIAVASVGARFNQYALVSIGTEHVATVKPHGYSLKQLWGFPLLIQKGI